MPRTATAPHDPGTTAPPLRRGQELVLPVVLRGVARAGIRYSLALVIGWIGLMKFTAYEAEAISGLIANSPLMGWLYGLLSLRDVSAVIGIVEVAAALLIAIRPVGPRSAIAAAVGATLVVPMFLTTLSFIATTPGAFEPLAGGFPALSAMPGQFLVKDTVLLAAAISLLAEALEVRGVTRDRHGR